MKQSGSFNLRWIMLFAGTVRILEQKQFWKYLQLENQSFEDFLGTACSPPLEHCRVENSFEDCVWKADNAWCQICIWCVSVSVVNAGKPRTQKRRGHAAIVALQTLEPEAQAVARPRSRADILWFLRLQTPAVPAVSPLFRMPFD